MKKVYFVRHGETTHNKENLVQDGGTLLTDAGVIQANRLAERLQHLDFDYLLVSDFERTRQTAEPVVKLTKKQAIYSDLFREVRRPSEFFHTPHSSTQYQKFLADTYNNFAVDEDWRHSDEENFADTTNRIKKALEYIETFDGDVVVISHGHFIIKLLATVATGGSLDGSTWQKLRHGFTISNTGISTIYHDEFHQSWKILTFNDHAHFAE